MKTGFFVAVLAQLAAAQPHRNHHQHLHQKRDVVTEIDIVTATAPDVVVFVNQWGEPVSTSYVHHSHSHTHYTEPTAPSSTLSQVSSTAAASVETSAAASSSETAYTSTPVETSAVPVSSSTTSSAAAATSSSSSSSSGSGLGITYSPYTADGDCKTQAQVTADFEQLSDYSLVRTYGTDCNTITTVGTAAIAKGMKLFAGIYDLSDVASEIATIVAFADGNWDNFDTISIGNELINSAQATVAEVVAAVGTARTLLTAAGYTGNVVTVDTWNAVLNNPELCEASDFAAINAHAFFDADATPATAGSIVQGYVAEVKAVCGGKTVVVTESGWPSQGESNGLAVPTVPNQETAVASLKSTFSTKLILFNAYNDLWKANFDGSFDAEQYWGIYGTSTNN